MLRAPREHTSRVTSGAVAPVELYRQRSMSGPREFFLQKLPQIERIVASICKRSGFHADAMEDFASDVKLRLVENDYAIVRAFGNRSSFEAYIGTVVRRLLLDQRNREWGKWRPSAEAQRLGALALELERLLYRDWRTLDDAAAFLTMKYGSATRAEIDGLAAKIPRRLPRRKVDIEQAASVTMAATETDTIRQETARRLSCLITSYVERLPEGDELIMRLHFQVGMSVAQIARALHLDQPTIYPRLYRHFAALRAELTRAGVSKRDVEDLIGSDIGLDFRFKNDDPRPSGEDEKDESAAAATHEERS